MALYLPCLFLSLLLVFAKQAKAIHHRHYKIYVVGVEICHEEIDMKERYLSILQEALGSRNKAVHALVRTYDEFCGFDARLTRKEAKKLAETSGVTSVFPIETIPLDFDELHSSMNDEELVGPTPAPIAH